MTTLDEWEEIIHTRMREAISEGDLDDSPNIKELVKCELRKPLGDLRGKRQ
jgi:hypothetical protein